MQIEFTRKFKKQIESLNDRTIRLKVLSIIDAVVVAEKMVDFPNLKKLAGYKNQYRIRLGNYRIGISINDQTVIFAALDHRSNIYKYFP